MDFINAIILGILEGFTEFLPISSTGHLIIANEFIHFEERFTSMFDIVIQLGAILSVVVYFWKRIFPFGTGVTLDKRKEIFGLWAKAIVGVTPALVLGALFDKKIEEHLFNPTTVAIALFIGGLVIIIMESRKKTASIATITALTFKTAFFIGLIQCIAMVPGTSRSAATIIGAMLLGASRVVAVEFSFFLAIPTMFAASGYSLLKHGGSLSMEQYLVLATGFITSFFVAWGSVAFLMSFIQKYDFKAFAYYRIVLAIVVVVLLR